MTALEFLESQGIWYNGTYADGTVKHYFIAALMQEYHDSEVKNLNIPSVIKSVCPKCNGKDVRPYKDHLCCYDCGNYWQTVL